MFAIVAALWITETAASGVGIRPATDVNLPENGRAEMVINNKTRRPIMFNYYNYACQQTVRSIDGRMALSSHDINRRSDEEKKSWNASLKVNGNGSPAGDKAPGGGGGIECAYGQSNERATTSEMQAQRGNDQSQNVAIVIDEELRNASLHYTFKVPVGLETKRFSKADEGHWQVTVSDEMGRVLARDKVFYDSKYIEITQDYRIKEQTEVPAEVSQALWPKPPCPRCLPIEHKSLEALRKLALTHIHVNGRDYNPAGLGTWRTQGHPSFIKAPRSYIGTQNPFLLFKMGDRSYDWFMQHSAEERQKLLTRLKNCGECGPGFDLGKHLQLVKSPATFSLAGEPIQVIGLCPRCGEMPNPFASN